MFSSTETRVPQADVMSHKNGKPLKGINILLILSASEEAVTIVTS
jgi:hypothetical protein